MQNHHEILGESIKPARIKADITVEAPAAKVEVTERFIRTKAKKPSYGILYKLIRELSILPDQIFFPEPPAAVGLRKVSKHSALIPLL